MSIAQIELVLFFLEKTVSMCFSIGLAAFLTAMLLQRIKP